MLVGLPRNRWESVVRGDCLCTLLRTRKWKAVGRKEEVWRNHSRNSRIRRRGKRSRRRGRRRRRRKIGSRYRNEQTV
jgi:hypothetical protein